MALEVAAGERTSLLLEEAPEACGGVPCHPPGERPAEDDCLRPLPRVALRSGPLRGPERPHRKVLKAGGDQTALLLEEAPEGRASAPCAPPGSAAAAEKGRDGARQASKASCSTAASLSTRAGSKLSSGACSSKTSMLADPLTGTLRPLSVELLEQRSHWPLCVAALALALYFAAGSLLVRARYGWSLVDTCYFLVVTLTTIGYGDKAFPPQPHDRILGGIFVFVGVAWIGWAVGVILSHFSSHTARAVSALVEASKLRRSNTPPLGEGASGMLAKDDLRTLLRRLGRCIVQVTLTIVIGVAVTMYCEGWGPYEAFYWVCVTTTTVGYGDVVPQRACTKWFTCVYSIFAFGFLAETLAYIANIPMEVQKARHISNVLHQFGNSLEQEELDAVVHSDVLHHIRSTSQREAGEANPSVQRAEFVLWMLVMQGKIGLEDVGHCAEIFDTLDPDRSGSLDSTDIAFFSRQPSRKTYLG